MRTEKQKTATEVNFGKRIILKNEPHYVNLSGFALAAECVDDKLVFYPYMYEQGEKYVYAIQIDDGMYVGSALHLKERIAVHHVNLMTGKHHSKKMQEVYNQKHRFKVFVIMHIRCKFKKEAEYAENLVIRLLTPSFNTTIPKGRSMESLKLIWSISHL